MRQAKLTPQQRAWARMQIRTRREALASTLTNEEIALCLGVNTRLIIALAQGYEYLDERREGVTDADFAHLTRPTESQPRG